MKKQESMKLFDKHKKDETTPTSTNKYRSPSFNHTSNIKSKNIVINRYKDEGADEDKDCNPFLGGGNNGNKGKIFEKYNTNTNVIGNSSSNNQTRFNSTNKKKLNEIVTPSKTKK